MRYGIESFLSESTYATIHSVLAGRHPQCYLSWEQQCEFHLPWANLACHHLCKWHCWKGIASLGPYTIHLPSLKKPRLFQGEHLYLKKITAEGLTMVNGRRLNYWKSGETRLKEATSGKIWIFPHMYTCHIFVCACVVVLIMRKGGGASRRCPWSYLSSIEDWRQKDLANCKTIHPQGISSPALPKGFHKAKKNLESKLICIYMRQVWPSKW